MSMGGAWTPSSATSGATKPGDPSAPVDQVPGQCQGWLSAVGSGVEWGARARVPVEV